MSLEDRLASLVDAITAHTDAIQHLAAALRMQSSPVVVKTAVPDRAGNAAVNEGNPSDAARVAAGEPKRGPGRPRKVTETPPPSPSAAAANGVSPQGAPAQLATTVQSPAAPNAHTQPGHDGAGTYADLQELVPKLAAEQGRSAAVAIFTKLGFASGRELQEKAPDKIPKAVALFRAALGVQ